MNFPSPVSIQWIADLIGAQLLGETTAFATGINEIHKVEEGDLVIFPGWVKHRTAPSASTQERIAICSNIKMEN